MALTPKTIHALDQLGGLSNEVAKLVASYRRALVKEGLTENEAWLLAEKLEERLLGAPFDQVGGMVAKDSNKEP